MRVVHGKTDRQMDRADVARWCEPYRQITIDLGAGDGRFVRHLARAEPRSGAIGVDLCAENLRAASRRADGNALFVVADALALPAEFDGIATRLTIYFPWGSLLRGLLRGDRGLLDGLQAVCRADAALEIALNADALADAGWTLEAGGDRVSAVLRHSGFSVSARRRLGAAEIRQYPTTWAKRLACGRNPNALGIQATRARNPTSVLPITQHPSPNTHVCYTSTLAGVEPASIRMCEPFCSVGRVSAQPHCQRQRGKPTGRRPRCANKSARPASTS
jgi:16S rRNA (adenine(1408)-N(1))-methyltransferase